MFVLLFDFVVEIVRVCVFVCVCVRFVVVCVCCFVVGCVCELLLRLVLFLVWCVPFRCVSFRSVWLVTF